MTSAVVPNRPKSNVRNRLVICVETTARGHILCDRTGAGWTPLLSACRSGWQRFSDIVMCLLFDATASPVEVETARAGVRRTAYDVAHRGDLPLGDINEMVIVPWFVGADCNANKSMLDAIIGGCEVSATRRPRLTPRLVKRHTRNANVWIFSLQQIAEHITNFTLVEIGVQGSIDQLEDVVVGDDTQTDDVCKYVVDVASTIDDECILV